MSRESTQSYYKNINEGIRARLGGLHSAEIILHSVDFQMIEELQHQGNRKELTKIMIANAQRIEHALADFLVIATNTMHKTAEAVAASINIPLLHIADPTAQEIQKSNIQTIGLLGTKFTMEQEFYAGRLEKQGIKVIIPSQKDREIVHNVIYNELCLGNIQESSKDAYISIINNLELAGAQGIVLGCTEIGLLIQQKDTSIPLFDTTQIHTSAIVDYALSK
ncbi:MAG: aspartate/glutamate racemase family protein [Candidatus Absconditabacterales bacterium]